MTFTFVNDSWRILEPNAKLVHSDNKNSPPNAFQIKNVFIWKCFVVKNYHIVCLLAIYIKASLPAVARPIVVGNFFAKSV